MSVGFTLKLIPFSSHTTKIFSDKFSGRPIVTAKCSLVSPPANQNLIEKIRERINNGKVEISSSAYDTAWVAMVPLREYSGTNQRPCFPECLDWIMENQNLDGSWGLDPGHPDLVKDSLSCTLACVLALHKWNLGHQLVQRGLDFIASNSLAASHNNHHLSPIGFNIIFPAMVNYAKELDLSLPLSPTLVDYLLQVADSEIRRNQNQDYVAEGFGNSCNWKGIISTHQRSNGSLFNSPATTAAALIHFHDEKCVEYLNSVLKACRRSVPTIYPMDIYTRLSLVDTLERLGINGYFGHEMGSILDETYRYWQQKEDEIFSDITCQAMAFRLLRSKGYDVSSDELAEFVDQKGFFNSVSIQYHSVATVLELYRASQVRIYEEEGVLEKIQIWTSSFLKQQLQNESIHDKRLQKQVEIDLKNFHGTLDRVGSRRSIELYDAQDFQILKTAYRCPTIHNENLILLSMKDFRTSQAQYQKELQLMERWYTECRLDRLTQGRDLLRATYMLPAAVIADPELSMARISYAKVAVLVTGFDDFFDLYGSKEEAFCIIKLLRNWNTQPATSYCSEEVEILFTALYNTVNEIAAKAYGKQDRCIKDDLVSMWLELLTSFVRQKDSWSDNPISTLDEYLSVAWRSIGCKLCVLTAIHFLGVKLSENMIKSQECISLTYHASLVCRLLNDLKTFKKEQGEMVLNSVSIQTVHEAISEEEAVLKVRKIIEYNRREVLRMVYKRDGGVLPRECKELFWKACKQAYCLYPHDGGDEFTSPHKIIKDMNAVIFESLELPPVEE